MSPTITSSGPVDTLHSPYSRLHPLPLGSVRFQDGFWKQIQTINHRESLYHAYDMLEKAGNFHNFKLAAGLIRGEYRGRNFIDTDVYKWLEALAWELSREPDEDLRKKADDAIQLVQAAQCEDGYLNCYIQVVDPAARWKDLDHGHELYTAGHMIQAGIAFYRSLGDRRLLDVSIRFADLIHATFGPGKQEGACGHPEIEMALVELYRTTGEKSYLETARVFIDRRGKKKMAGFGAYGPEYHQDHIPVREATTAEGHAVRQLYLNSGVTDLYLETGEAALWESMQRLWKDIAGTKLYITGGVGARFDGEAFGDSYELPPDQCYCETCAAIANVQWNWRMLLASGDSRYADMIERSLFNTILSSPALDGRHFFYVNPLQVRGGKYTRLSQNPPDGESYAGRPEWHSVSCCPPNVMRTFSSLEHYAITQTEEGIQIHQYAPMEIDIHTPSGGRIILSMQTGYPYDGKMILSFKKVEGFAGKLFLRKPDWCPSVSLSLNGQNERVVVEQNGYLLLDRPWADGDRLEMDLSPSPALIEANPRVDATRGCVALQYGPLVFCLESFDQQYPEAMLDMQIDTDKPVNVHWRKDLPGGVLTLEASGFIQKMEPWQGILYSPVQQVKEPARENIKLVAIPYYAWGNRGIGSMRVWIPRAD